MSYAQSVERFLKNVSNTENIDKVKIGRFMMSLGKMFGGVGNTPVARGIHSLEVYDLSGCDARVKQDFLNQINSLKDGDGYETLIMVKDKGDNVRIMMKKKKDVISDLVILCMDDKEPTIVKLSGKIKEKDVSGLVDKYN
ncbi:hypothetical protein FACS1894179_02090 [Bacteroidia bacterium]|nr:hypothetical protein FACS1894169_08910 [Bacteroidia bacterium]GHV38540.1 hypothetical protein FACS1894179_02090 [Bacteroidia bacterium]